MNPWYVFGPLFAAWAVVVALLGITRANFPGTLGAARVVGGISILLAVLAIASAIYGGIHD